MKQSVFIAGPYRSTVGPYGIKKNIDVALDVARAVWAQGRIAVCPHGNSYMMDGSDIPDESFLEGAQLLLSICDTIALLPGWMDSEGARAELRLAQSQGKRVEVVQPRDGKWAFLHVSPDHFEMLWEGEFC